MCPALHRVTGCQKQRTPHLHRTKHHCLGMWQALSLVGAAKLLKELGVPMTLAELRDCDASAQSRIIHTLLAHLSRSQPPLTDQRCAVSFARQHVIRATTPLLRHASSLQHTERRNMEKHLKWDISTCAVTTPSCAWRVTVLWERCLA